jgi:hypothetical protein
MQAVPSCSSGSTRTASARPSRRISSACPSSARSSPIPGYFSAENKELVRLIRGLSPAGNLRLGGSSGEHTDYIGDETRPPPFEIFGPEHNKTIKQGMFVSTAALRTLRGFLDATGWNCLYGLNLAHATPEQAAREAADVQRILGPRLLALQIGNEPDAFRNRFRPRRGDRRISWQSGIAFTRRSPPLRPA